MSLYLIIILILWRQRIRCLEKQIYNEELKPNFCASWYLILCYHLRNHRQRKKEIKPVNISVPKCRKCRTREKELEDQGIRAKAAQPSCSLLLGSAADVKDHFEQPLQPLSYWLYFIAVWSRRSCQNPWNPCLNTARLWVDWNGHSFQ